MKKLLILALIIFAKSAFAQKDTVGLKVPFVNNTVVYERVFDVPNAPKDLLYSNAGLWLAETHPYVADTQLQLADPVLSRVVGRVTSSNVVSYKVLWQTNYLTDIYNFTVHTRCSYYLIAFFKFFYVFFLIFLFLYLRTYHKEINHQCYPAKHDQLLYTKASGL